MLTMEGIELRRPVILKIGEQKLSKLKDKEGKKSKHFKLYLKNKVELKFIDLEFRNNKENQTHSAIIFVLSFSPNLYIEVQIPVHQNETLLGNRVVVDVVKMSSFS